MLGTLFLLCALQQAAPRAPHEDLPALATGRLRQDLRFLSSDTLEGRATGTRGADTAARWIACRFLRLGLAPAGDDYFHTFAAEPVRLDAGRTALRLHEPGTTPGSSEGTPESAGAAPVPGAVEAWSAGEHLLPHPGSLAGSASGGLVFAGYALTAPEHDYDDLYGLDLAGKVVLLFRWEPQADDDRSRFAGRRFLTQSRLREKILRVEGLGAAAVLVATPPGTHESWEAPWAPYWPAHSKFFNALLPMVQVQVDAAEIAKSNFTHQDVADQYFCLLQVSGPLGCRVPVAGVSRPVVERIFAAAGRRAHDWVRETDASGAGEGFAVPLQASLTVAHQPVARSGRNVVAVLPGSDPLLRHEIVVLGAHYDHVGRNEEGVIWNGADDNGSGTVGLLALADSFARRDPAPRRTLVFVAFAGEEIGLLGAWAFLAQSVVPLGRITAMVNLDMIGRSVNRSVHAVGTRSSSDMRRVVENAAAGLDVHVDFEHEEFFDRSDQAAFYAHGIPIVFFNTAEHEDYHKPSDTWDRIDYTALAAITGLARRVTLTLCNMTEPLSFEDGYRRMQPAWGRSPRSAVPWPVPFEQRLDY